MVKKRRTADDFRADIKAKQRTTPGDVERKQKIATAAAQALRELKNDTLTYEKWRQVGEQLLVITEETLADLGLDAWDKDNKKLAREFTQRFEGWERSVSNAKPITRQERWALRELMTEPNYHTWYTTDLTGPERRRLNHPNKIIESYKRKHPDPNKPKAGRQISNLLSPALTEKNKQIADLVAQRDELRNDYEQVKAHAAQVAINQLKSGSAGTASIATASLADMTPRISELLTKLNRAERLQVLSDLAAPFPGIQVSHHLATIDLSPIGRRRKK
jgi:hypothetical protein